MSIQEKFREPTQYSTVNFSYTIRYIGKKGKPQLRCKKCNKFAKNRDINNTLTRKCNNCGYLWIK